MNNISTFQIPRQCKSILQSLVYRYDPTLTIKSYLFQLKLRRNIF